MPGSVAKNTLYLTTASILQKALAFGYYLFIANHLSTQQTGKYFLALSLSLMFSVIADFGITSVVIREIAKAPERGREFIQRAIGFKLPFLFIGFIATVLAPIVMGHDQVVQELVFLAAILMIADTFSLFFYGILRGYQVLKYESLGIFIGQSLTLVCGVSVILSVFRLSTPAEIETFFPTARILHLLIFSLMIGSFFNLFFSGFHVIRRLGTRTLLPIWEKTSFTRFLLLSLPFAIAGIFARVSASIDSLLIYSWLGDAALGVYSIAYKFTYAFQFIPLAFVGALYPAFSASLEREQAENTETLFNKSMRYLALVGIPITFGIWALAPDLVLLTGKQYTYAAPVLQVIIFSLIPLFLDFPVGALLNAAGRQNLKTGLMGAGMVLAIVFNSLLIPVFGTMGSAYTALLSTTSVFCIGMLFVKKIIPTYRYAPLVKHLFSIGLSGWVMGMAVIFARPTLGLYLAIPFGTLTYVAILFLTRSVSLADIRSIRTLMHCA